MYFPRQVGVFFLLLFFLKVASFACIDGMCSNFILQVFSFFFRGWGRVLIRFSVAASRVPRREDVLQRNYENSASLLEKLRNKYLDLQYLDIFCSNSTYVKGLQERYQKLQKINISK